MSTEQRGGFRSNWFLVQFIVGISVVLLIVQAMSACWWYAEIVLIKRELAGGSITVAEAVRVDFWNDLLMKLTIGFAVVNFLSFIVWLVRAARNARALTGKHIHVTVSGLLFFQLWIHKILSDLWLAGSSAPESAQTKPRLPRLMIVWCVLVFVCGLWKPPMSTGRTLSEAIETPPVLRPEFVQRWRHDVVGWLLPDCKTLFVASLVHMFSTVLMAAGIVWIDRMHTRKWDAMTGVRDDSLFGRTAEPGFVPSDSTTRTES
jgi:hypothetical protein